jgi:D-glycero-alpha-D-manno-heptose-7-phosphate kinase
MIVTRTPFRITLGGGGTDLPSFYEQHGGFVFSMCINKYMHIIIARRSIADRKIIIRYSQVETVDTIDEIKHPLAREALRLHSFPDAIELTSVADMPAKAGLGSSGSYLVGVLTAIRAYMRNSCTTQELAEEACRIEMEILKEPVGKQDQYMAAYGGFRTLEISRQGKVEVHEVPVDFITVNELVSNARVYYTGVQRAAMAVLKDQDKAAREKKNPEHNKVVDCLCRIKELGHSIKDAFVQRDMDAFGRLMDEHWQCKKQMSPSISLTIMDTLYDEAKKQFGVLGGKIIGAGGGGFVMLYCPRRNRDLDEFMARNGMPRVGYYPSQQGAHVVSDLTVVDEFANPFR